MMYGVALPSLHSMHFGVMCTSRIWAAAVGALAAASSLPKLCPMIVMTIGCPWAVIPDVGPCVGETLTMRGGRYEYGDTIS